MLQGDTLKRNASDAILADGTVYERKSWPAIEPTLAVGVGTSLLNQPKSTATLVTKP